MLYALVLSGLLAGAPALMPAVGMLPVQTPTISASPEAQSDDDAASPDTVLVRIVQEEAGRDWLALIALLAAAAGTVFAGVQARLARRTLQATTMPAVSIVTNLAGESDMDPGIHLHNSGPGIAIVKSFTIVVDGEPIAETDKGGWSAAVGRLGLIDADWRKTWYLEGDYISPGERAQLFTYRREDWSANDAAFRKALRRIRIRIKVESTLGSESTSTWDGADVVVLARKG